MLGVVLMAAVSPGAALATNDFPDFYGTIVALSADQRAITVAPDAQQRIIVDVSELGRQPWDEGAFRLDNVVLLHTKRIGDALVATGWEQARDGSDEFDGVGPRRFQPKKARKEN